MISCNYSYVPAIIPPDWGGPIGADPGWVYRGGPGVDLLGKTLGWTYRADLGLT